MKPSMERLANEALEHYLHVLWKLQRNVWLVLPHAYRQNLVESATKSFKIYFIDNLDREDPSPELWERLMQLANIMIVLLCNS